MTFDYGLPADLFMLKRKVKRKAGARQRLGYRRFATADFLKLGQKLQNGTIIEARKL